MKRYFKYQPAWTQLIVFGMLTIGMLLLMGIALYVVASLFHIPITSIGQPDANNPNELAAAKVAQAVSVIFFFALPALLFGYLSDPQPMKYLGFQPPKPARFYILGVGLLLAAIPLVGWLGEWNSNLHLPQSMASLEKTIRALENEAGELTRAFMKGQSFGDLVVSLLLMAILPAFVEELFFRGVMQRIFIQITKSPLTGILITAFIFSAIHMQFLGFFPRFLLGALLGAAYWYSGSLWTSIIAHCFFNGLQIVLAFYNPQYIDKDPTAAYWVVILSFAVVIGLLWRMQSISRIRYQDVYPLSDTTITTTDDEED